MTLLVVATERGLWRAAWDPRRPPRIEDFHVDAPEEPATALRCGPDGPVALLEDGRLLVWEVSAAAFREGPRLETAGAEISALALDPRGRPWAGLCPAALHRLVGGRWEEVPLPAPGEPAWTGLEAPYEPRVSSLLPRERECWVAVSVGGLLRRSPEGWSVLEAARDQRALCPDPWSEDGIWAAGGRGLHRHRPPDPPRRASLPPRAAFAAQVAAAPAGLLVAAAPGPPATWYGPEGARMSLWHFGDPAGVGRPVAGPLHGPIRGLCADGAHALFGTEDGEVWRVPLAGPAPPAPWLQDLPPVRGLCLVEETAPRV